MSVDDRGQPILKSSGEESTSIYGGTPPLQDIEGRYLELDWESGWICLNLRNDSHSRQPKFTSSPWRLPTNEGKDFIICGCLAPDSISQSRQHSTGHSRLHFVGLPTLNIFILGVERMCDHTWPTWADDVCIPMGIGRFLTTVFLLHDYKLINCMHFDTSIIFIFEPRFTMHRYRTIIYYLLLPARDCTQKLRYLITSHFLR